jgi:hypothetical protein
MTYARRLSLLRNYLGGLIPWGLSFSTPGAETEVVPDYFCHPLDEEKFYKLDDAEAAFFEQQTGIRDAEELKKHIIGIQQKAFAVGVLYEVPWQSID